MLICSEKSGGTNSAEARVLRNRPAYLRSATKLISPGTASASDAAPVILSSGSPANSPPHMSASSRRVKVTEKEALKFLMLGAAASARKPSSHFPFRDLAIHGF